MKTQNILKIYPYIKAFTSLACNSFKKGVTYAFPKRKFLKQRLKIKKWFRYPVSLSHSPRFEHSTQGCASLFLTRTSTAHA